MRGGCPHLNYKGESHVFQLSVGLENTEDGDIKSDHELSSLSHHCQLWYIDTNKIYENIMRNVQH